MDDHFKAQVIGEYLAPIHGEDVIAVNDAWRFGEWIDIIFWGDCRWTKPNMRRPRFMEHPAQKVTCCHKKPLPDDAIVLGRSKVMEPRLDKVFWYSNSGASALAFASCLAREVILLGFDMKRKGSFNNWHDYHPHKPRPSAYRTYRADFWVIREALERWPWPVKVINANLHSALHHFQKVAFENLI
jgi:hypothetical protein